MSKVENVVYLSLGGNIGDTSAILKHSLSLISAIPGIKDLEVSSFYKTAPVSDIPQSDYLNAVCRFKTILPPQDLFNSLQAIETAQGKFPKPKNAPRIIDIDMIFYGSESHRPAPDFNLEIPHPRWHERLFVVIPLLDLTSTITIPGNSGNDHGEQMIDLIKLKDSLLRESTAHDKDKICIKYL